MGFKLGKGYKNYMTNGSLRTKLRFGQEAGDNVSVPGTPVIRKPLAPGVMGEANMDGSIYISDQIIPNSQEEAEVINHEMRHATDMKVGKLSYGDDFVQYNGEIYPRKTINGKDMIRFEGKWKEAGDNFPWENDANNGK
jgi:hypothetical protein